MNEKGSTLDENERTNCRGASVTASGSVRSSSSLPGGGNTDECTREDQGGCEQKKQPKLKEKEKESGGPGSHVPGFQCRNGGAPLLAGVFA